MYCYYLNKTKYLLLTSKSAVGFGKSHEEQECLFCQKGCGGRLRPDVRRVKGVLVAEVLDGCFDGAGVQGMCPCPVSFLPLFFAGSKKSGYGKFK
jgi:hypothetical protein